MDRVPIFTRHITATHCHTAHIARDLAADGHTPMSIVEMTVLYQYIRRSLVDPPSIRILAALDGDAVVVSLDMHIANGHPGRGIDIDAVAAGYIVLRLDMDPIDGESVGEKDMEAPKSLVENFHSADASTIAMVETDGLGSAHETSLHILPFQALGINRAATRDPTSVIVIKVEQCRTSLLHTSLPASGDDGIEGGVDYALQRGTLHQMQIDPT